MSSPDKIRKSESALTHFGPFHGCAYIRALNALPCVTRCQALRAPRQGSSLLVRSSWSPSPLPLGRSGTAHGGREGEGRSRRRVNGVVTFRKGCAERLARGKGRLRHLARREHPTAQDAWLLDSRCYTRQERCIDRLNAPRPSSPRRDGERAVCVHPDPRTRACGAHALSRARGVEGRVLRVVSSPPQRADAGRPGVDEAHPSDSSAESGYVRQSAGPSGATRGRDAVQSETRRTVDAGGRARDQGAPPPGPVLPLPKLDVAGSSPVARSPLSSYTVGTYVCGRCIYSHVFCPPVT